MEFRLKQDIDDWNSLSIYVESEYRKIAESKSKRKKRILGISAWIVLFLVFFLFGGVLDHFHWPTAILVTGSLIFFYVIDGVQESFYNQEYCKLLAPSPEGILFGEIVYTIDGGGISSVKKNITTFINWEGVTNIERSNGYIFIFIDSAQAYIFSEEKLDSADEFYSLISNFYQSTKI